MTLGDQWRGFDHGDPLYRELLQSMADDLDAGGPAGRPAAEIFADHLDASISDVVHLRVLGGGVARLAEVHGDLRQAPRARPRSIEQL